jgi:hypothetical protein
VLSRSKHRRVGAHEHCEAAIAVYQKGRHRGLAVLVRSYRKRWNSHCYFMFDKRAPGQAPTRRLPRSSGTGFMREAKGRVDTNRRSALARDAAGQAADVSPGRMLSRASALRGLGRRLPRAYRCKAVFQACRFQGRRQLVGEAVCQEKYLANKFAPTEGIASLKS